MTEFAQAKKLLEESNTILLTTHMRTDGDDLGSVLALGNFLSGIGKKVAVVIEGGVPDALKYLPMSDKVLEKLPNEKFDVLVISGCSSLARVGHAEIMELKIPIINLDHHPDNTNYGTVNVVDSTKSAVAELTYDFFKFCGWEITHDIALCMLTGIITDTGIFMHSNTEASTLAAAAELMEHGARVSTITKHTYQTKDLESLKAWAHALGNAHYDPVKKMIYSVITSDELASLGNPPMSAFEGIAETLNKVPEAKFAMFLKQEKEDLIKGSLRSEEYKGVDVQAIAQSLGGGGHKLAAGFSLYGRLAKDDRGHWKVI